MSRIFDLAELPPNERLTAYLVWRTRTLMTMTDKQVRDSTMFDVTALAKIGALELERRARLETE